MVSCHYILNETEAEEEGVKVVLNTKLELYINGDYKFLFKLIGRLGCCGGYCLY
jgi:hypothetical protein